MNQTLFVSFGISEMTVRCYLDIETTGISWKHYEVTVVGLAIERHLPGHEHQPNRLDGLAVDRQVAGRFTCRDDLLRQGRVSRLARGAPQAWVG